MDAKDCRDCEKFTWVSGHAGGSIGSGTFPLILHLFLPPFFPHCGPKNKEVSFRKEFDVLPRPYTSGTVAIPLLFEALRLNSRGHQNNFWDFFLSFCQKPCNSCGEKLCLLCSDVNWSGNFKSLPIKDSAQIRVVQEHLPNINLTFTREPQDRRSWSLTRVRKFFQIQCPTVSSACLYFARNVVAPVLTTAMESLTAMLSTFNHLPDFRLCWILLGSFCQ